MSGIVFSAIDVLVTRRLTLRESAAVYWRAMKWYSTFYVVAMVVFVTVPLPMLRMRVPGFGAPGRGERVNEVYDAMEEGALDVVDMPWLDSSSVLHGVSSLVRKLALAARLGARRAADRVLREAAPSVFATSAAKTPSSPPPATVGGAVLIPARGHAPAMVAIGASTGGPNAVSRVLASLPRLEHRARRLTAINDPDHAAEIGW